MSLRDWLLFLARSVVLGLAVAALVLLLLPYLQGTATQQRQAAPVSFAHAVNRAAPAVVNIYSVGEIRGSFFNSRPTTVWRLGSGVIMDSRGYIMTAYHVVADVDQIEVALQDGRVSAAQLIGYDRYTDLALLKVDLPNLPVIPQNNNHRIRAGDVVLAIGNPYNLGQTITQGIISATGGRIGVSNPYADLIQMDAVINEGASGGALVNSRGDLVGINNASYNSLTGDGGEGIYFAVPRTTATYVMSEIIANGAVIRGYLGIKINDNTSLQRNVPGITVSEVAPRSPAALAGLQVGDYIVRMNGEVIDSPSKGLNIVAYGRPGEQIKIEFYRGNQLLEAVATLQPLPQ